MQHIYTPSPKSYTILNSSIYIILINNIHVIILILNIIYTYRKLYSVTWIMKFSLLIPNAILFITLSLF